MKKTDTIPGAEGTNCMDISIGDIASNPILSFCRKESLVTIKKINKDEAQKLYEKYLVWCRGLNLHSLGRATFYCYLRSFNILT